MRNVIKSGIVKPHTLTEIFEMQYAFQFCNWCDKKMDCCLDTVIVTTYGTYCTICWGRKMSNYYDNKVNEFVRKRKEEIPLSEV